MMKEILTEACFVAGTLVHTKDGLKLIEEIKVGDLVLSKPENPAAGGELAYKRVLKTFVHENKAIKQIGYMNGPNSKEERTYRLFATFNHPFWVKDKGWTAASELEGDWSGPSHLELMSGKTAYSEPQYVYQTPDKGIGWITYAGFEGEGETYNFNANKYIENCYFDCNNWPLHDVDEGGDGDGYIYKTTVYNIEVEDYHTYFVGEHGVWVHNANCDGSANL